MTAECNASSTLHSYIIFLSTVSVKHVCCSTITAWNQTGESAAYLNMLKQFPSGLLSVVSDSYDLFHAVTHIWGEELRKYVLERAEKGCLVIRPDSGDPSQVIVKVRLFLSLFSSLRFYFAFISGCCEYQVANGA